MAPNALCVALFQGGKYLDGFEVGVQLSEQAARRYLSGHKSVACAQLFHRLEHVAQLANFYHGALPFGEAFPEFGACLAFKGYKAAGKV